MPTLRRPPSPSTIKVLQTLVYTFTACCLFFLPTTGDAAVWLSFRLGEQAPVAESGNRPLIGVEASAQFHTPVALDLGLDYVRPNSVTTPPLGGYRGSLGVSYPVRLFCIFPFRIVPGMGVSYSHPEGASEVEGPGFHLRGRVLADILGGVSAGLEIRRDWGPADLRESALVFQYRF